jgi:hypothetical protein
MPEEGNQPGQGQGQGQSQEVGQAPSFLLNFGAQCGLSWTKTDCELVSVLFFVEL